MRYPTRTIAMLTAAAMLTAVVPAAAQARSTRADNIERRIDKGLHDGSLTWREAQRLRRQLYAAERAEHYYGRDGMTGWEARNIKTRYDLLSNRVWNQRHDAQHAWARW